MSKDTVCLICAVEALNIGLKFGDQFCVDGSFHNCEYFLRSSVCVSGCGCGCGCVVVVVVVVVVVEIALTKLGLDSRQVYLDRHSSPEVVGSFSDAESIKVLDLRTSCTEAIYWCFDCCPWSTFCWWTRVLLTWACWQEHLGKTQYSP